MTCENFLMPERLLCVIHRNYTHTHATNAFWLSHSRNSQKSWLLRISWCRSAYSVLFIAITHTHTQQMHFDLVIQEILKNHDFWEFLDAVAPRSILWWAASGNFEKSSCNSIYSVHKMTVALTLAISSLRCTSDHSTTSSNGYWCGRYRALLRRI